MHQPCACLGAVVALCSAWRPRPFHLATWPSVAALPPRMAAVRSGCGQVPGGVRPRCAAALRCRGHRCGLEHRGHQVPRSEAFLRLGPDLGRAAPEGDSGTARARDDRRDDGHLRAPVPGCQRAGPWRRRRDVRPGWRAPNVRQGTIMNMPPQARAWAGGEPACRPGSVHPRKRGPTAIHLGLPLPTASCGLPASIGRATLNRSRRPRAPEGARPL
jgi:hypothetical protein